MPLMLFISTEDGIPVLWYADSCLPVANDGDEAHASLGGSICAVSFEGSSAANLS